MKIKVLVGATAVAAVGLFGFGAPVSHAVCDSGPTRSVDENGNPDGTDTVTTLPNGSTIYNNGDGTSGNAGITGSTGYIEAGGEAADPSGGYIQGSTADDSVNGRVGASGVCVNDNSAP